MFRLFLMVAISFTGFAVMSPDADAGFRRRRAERTKVVLRQSSRGTRIKAHVPVGAQLDVSARSASTQSGCSGGQCNPSPVPDAPTSISITQAAVPAPPVIPTAVQVFQPSVAISTQSGCSGGACVNQCGSSGSDQCSSGSTRGRRGRRGRR